MRHYYVNEKAQPTATGEHEVHQEYCSNPADVENRHGLGSFFTCQDAMKAAKKVYPNVDGCRFCIPECHKM